MGDVVGPLRGHTTVAPMPAIAVAGSLTEAAVGVLVLGFGGGDLKACLPLTFA